MGQIISSFSSSLEQYTNPMRPERPPLSGSQALEALHRAEQIDGYRTAVNESSLNRLARSKQTYMPAVYSQTLSIPPADPTQPWPNGQVVWMDPTADGGLPHTRAPYFICLPTTILPSSLNQTLTHERIHVSQRLHPDAWIALMKTSWSMTPWNGSLPEELEFRHRINPDLYNAPRFIWKNQWVPFAIFQSTDHPDLSEINLIWWDDSSRTIHRDPPPGWTNFFGSNPSGEHPYEIAAYLLAGNTTTNKAYQALLPGLPSLPTNEV